MKGQSIQLLTDKPGVSIRGLSVVDDQFLWVSGSKGTVGKSVDGGAHWEWFNVKGFEQNDFRDIEAFDASTAVIMAVAAPAFIGIVFFSSICLFIDIVSVFQQIISSKGWYSFENCIL